MQHKPKTQVTEDSWHAILHASHCLLGAAQSGDWDQLTALAEQRDALIRAYFSIPVTVENAQQVHEKIIELLALDEQVLGLARSAQHRLKPVLLDQQRSKKAITAYQQQTL